MEISKFTGSIKNIKRMKFFLSLLFTLCVILINSLSYAQGCSDAGVCSVGSLNLIQFKFVPLPADKNTMQAMVAEDTKLIIKLNGLENDTVLPLRVEEKEDPKLNNQVSTATDSIDDSVLAGYYYRYPKYSFQFSTSCGSADQGTSVVITQLEGNMSIFKQKLFAQVKLPYSFINGKLASINGLNDITISMSYVVFSKNKNSLSITGGVKVPSNNSNLSIDDLPLPMVYQTSLGSTDALIGAKYTYNKWDLTCGYQHAFNANKNEYLHNSLVTDNETYNDYFESREMKRADDAIFRVNRNFKIKKAITSAGLLFIYHLADDDITNAAGQRIKAQGSQGLTLNLNFAAMAPVSKKMDFVFIFGSPLVIREARPDGLTRSYIAMAGLKYNIYNK